jgi:pyruvyl transferase EpsO
MSISQEIVAHARIPKRSHTHVMDELKNRLQRLRDIVPPSTPILYIDYPVHGNIGDLMIHAGADAFLEDHGYDVVGRYSGHDLASAKEGKDRECIHEIDRWVAKGVTIILHGGGNIGDIWPRHQELREFLIRRYPHAPIVIFPQSVHFNDAAARARSAAILRRHKNIRFFLRDEESLEFARECHCSAEVLPDMAHYLWKRAAFAIPTKLATGGVLVQRRRDKERAQSLQPSAFDWDDVRSMLDRVSQKVLVRWYKMDHPFRDAVPNWWSWYIVRDRLIRRAVARFSPYEAINTDRLHGMILGALLEKQILFCDNYYGKLSRYYRLWLAGSDRIGPADAQTQPGQNEIVFDGAKPVVSSPSKLSLR